MSSFMRFTLMMQLLGFMTWGWIVGGWAEYRARQERAFTAEVLLQMPARKLSEIQI